MTKKNNNSNMRDLTIDPEKENEQDKGWSGRKMIALWILVTVIGCILWFLFTQGSHVFGA